MKKYILSLLITVGLIGSSSAQYFSDNFSGNIIDPTKWNVLLPFSDSSVIQNNGLTLNNWGQITSTGVFTSPYEVNLNNVVPSSFDILSIGVRTDGVHHFPNGTTQGYSWEDGFRVGIWMDSHTANASYIDPNGNNLYNSGNLPFTPSSSYNLRLVDNQKSIDFYVNSQLIISFNSTLSSGENVAIYNRPDQESWGIPSSTAIGSAQISSVPEPSTYALFGMGAIGLLMVLRRKKTA